jgi:hypothetical protein
VAKLKDRLSGSKRKRKHSNLEKFDLKRLDDVEFKEKYQVEIANLFTALEKLDENIYTNNA